MRRTDGSIYLSYHSEAQVLVGLAVGAATAAVWFWVAEPLLRRTGVFTSSWARALYVRDYGPIPNAIAFEYAAVQRAIAAFKPDPRRTQ
jgi:hypothetical protein